MNATTKSKHKSQITGQIVALIKGGYTIDVKSGCAQAKSLHVYTTSSTQKSGPKPAVGRYAQVTPASGSCSTSVTAAAATVSNASPAGLSISAQSTSFVWSTIDGATASKIVLTPQNGLTGYTPVYTSASTIFAGAAPGKGLYAAVTGSGPMKNFNGSFVAISPAAPSTLTVSGTATASTAYGFTLNAGPSYPAIPIVMQGNTASSGGLVTGATVTVTGMGWESIAIVASSVAVPTPTPSPTPVPTATPAPTPTPLPVATASPLPTAAPTSAPPTISQRHLLTADYLGAPYGSTSVAYASAATYLTWAQVAPANATAIAATGIKTQYYSDPNQSTSTGDPLWTTDETEFAHDCNGNRISWKYNNVTLYQMNIGAASLQTTFANYVKYIASKAHFDAVWEDGTGILSNQGLPALPCNYTDSAWLSSGNALAQSSSLPVFVNGIEMGIKNGSLSPNMSLLSSSNTVGGSYESCYSANSAAKESGWIWADVENTELTVSAENKLFECNLRNTNSASGQTDARIYALASFLLTYNPASSVLWEEFTTPSGFRVEPESQLVALDPKVPTPSAVSALAQTGGTYGREYGRCYYAGKLVGACAVVVNPDATNAHPFPFAGYAHTLVLSGGGAMDGGTVSTTGPAPAMTVPADSAVVVFP